MYLFSREWTPAEKRASPAGMLKAWPCTLPSTNFCSIWDWWFKVTYITFRQSWLMRRDRRRRARRSCTGRCRPRSRSRELQSCPAQRILCQSSATRATFERASATRSLRGGGPAWLPFDTTTSQVPSIAVHLAFQPERHLVRPRFAEDRAIEIARSAEVTEVHAVIEAPGRFGIRPRVEHRRKLGRNRERLGFRATARRGAVQAVLTPGAIGGVRAPSAFNDGA